MKDLKKLLIIVLAWIIALIEPSLLGEFLAAIITFRELKLI